MDKNIRVPKICPALPHFTLYRFCSLATRNAQGYKRKVFGLHEETQHRPDGRMAKNTQRASRFDRRYRCNSQAVTVSLILRGAVGRPLPSNPRLVPKPCWFFLFSFSFFSSLALPFSFRLEPNTQYKNKGYIYNLCFIISCACPAGFSPPTRDPHTYIDTTDLWNLSLLLYL